MIHNDNFGYHIMIPYIQYWKKIDLINLKKECKQYFLDDKPPPRCIIQGKINLKHFLYQIHKLKQMIQTNESIHVVISRKLKNRELQIKELRQRVDRQKTCIAQHEKEIARLKLKNKKLTILIMKNQ